MRILFFIENLRSGGKERRLVELLKRLSTIENMKLDLVLTTREIHYKEIHELPVTIHYAERKYLKKDPRVFFLFFKLAWQIKPDLIHAWGNMVAIYTVPTKVLLGIPMINSQITDAPQNSSNGFFNHKFTFPFSDRIVANSEAGLKAYDAPRKKSLIIYNGFDFKRLSLLQSGEVVRTQFNITTKYVVGMVASISVWKDYVTYVLAAVQVLKQRKDVTFLCVGSGDDSIVRAMIPTEFICNIRFLGKQDDIESIMNICDIGVLCTHGEGISNALLEFASLGKPILASNNGGTPELIEDGKSGYLLKPYSSDDLSIRVVELLNDSNSRSEMGARGKDIVLQKFGIDQMTTNFLQVYRECLKTLAE
ncbi:MAG: glycosyltransferase family 4 protein [Flavobacteriales bacterium]|nr:glycosyltransferase family 4 protein [Flavobacteriales bacterium]